MRRGMEEPARREIRMQSGQESLKLLFFDTLEPEERTLAEMIRPEQRAAASQKKSSFLQSRERRMLKESSLSVNWRLRPDLKKIRYHLECL